MNNLIIFFLLLSLISCGQDYNSNSFDDVKYGDSGIDVSTPAGLRFSLAYNVISDNCVACHTGYHNSYAAYTTSEKWVEEGLVIAGDFDNSLMITKLINYGGNMPLSGSQLSDSEIALLEDWINNL